MKEIEYRGKRLDNNKWVYGYYVHNIDKKTAYDNFSDEPNQSIGKTTTKLIDRYLIVDERLDFEVVYVETIGQYTGEKDKNNVNIYEDDILQSYDNEWIGRVEYDFGGFYLTDTQNNYRFRPIWSDWEIIGNIHDNPELVGGAE